MKNDQINKQEGKENLSDIIQNSAGLRPYLLDKFDCTEFTEFGIEDLKNAGYNCRMIEDWVGPKGDRTFHAYGECDDLLIEFTYDDGTGKIVPPTDYENYGSYCKKHNCLELAEEWN